MAEGTLTTERHVDRTLSFIEDVFGDLEPRDFALRLWDGSRWGAAEDDARFTLALKHPGALRRMFVPPTDLTVGEAYIYDDFDVEGDLAALYDVGDRLGILDHDRADLARYAAKLLRLPKGGPGRRVDRGAGLRGRAHTKPRDAAAIRYHYDVSNDFFALWLDRAMVYSCAYFADPSQDLDTAQERKLDHICRKLRLRPGERLLDIGCGWGGLLVHAATRYGVDATGVTLSVQQAEYARGLIAGLGLQDRCRVQALDYRDVSETHPYDKLVSVGMFEHVGSTLLPTYFAKASRLLKPGGVFLNHGISSNALEPPPRGPAFSDVYVFPDGELLPVSTTLGQAELAGFEVRDVEDLREHYALTLHAWVRRLEERAEEARELTDDVTYRVWRLFMSFSAHQFERNIIGVHQALLAKPHEDGRSGLPLTREDWYR